MFEGIYAPIPTPFDNAENIYWDKLKNNLKWWDKTELDGIVVAGSNGEAAMLNSKEKISLFSFVRENTSPQKKVIAGTGCESFKATRDLNLTVANCGIDAVLVINPSFFKSSLNDQVIKNYYLHVAENSPKPVILYNMPRNTAINLNAETVIALSEHPNIIGIKDSSGNITQISEIINNTSDNFTVFAGSASFLLPSLLMGANGGTLALANIAPDQCISLYKLFRANQLSEAIKLQQMLIEINDAVTGRFGVAGLKAALDILGHYGGPPRLPLVPLNDEKKEILAMLMNKTGLIKH